MIYRYGPNRVATFYVGLHPGKKSRRRADCADAPSSIPVDVADQAFLSLRAEQVGSHVGATRLRAEGWYEAEPEPSLVYQIVYVPSEYEHSPRSFVRNMESLAERLAAELCQDEIIVVYDDSLHRVALGADPMEPRVRPASRAEIPAGLRHHARRWGHSRVAAKRRRKSPQRRSRTRRPRRARRAR